MTRINLVPPETLTDKHLLAEYKEITRPFNKVIKRIEKGTMGEVKIPERYCLGTGHETFFFDKLYFLYKRYQLIYWELTNYRKFKLDWFKFREISKAFSKELGLTPYWNDYKPTPEEIYLNMARLCKRSKIDSVLNELEGDS